MNSAYRLQLHSRDAGQMFVNVHELLCINRSNTARYMYAMLSIDRNHFANDRISALELFSPRGMRAILFQVLSSLVVCVLC